MGKNINELLIQLEEQIPFFKTKNEKISSADVGWHIEHSLLVIMKICESVSSSNPAKYKWKFNLKRLIAWLLGSLPRGKAKAPAAVIPGALVTISSLKISFEQARKSLDEIRNCHPNQYFYHPIFGKIKRDDTLEFLAIHTDHHLKIIREIVDNV